MKRQPYIASLVLLIVNCVVIAAHGQTVDEIVDRAIAADEKEDERLKEYEYQQTIVTQKLKEDGQVKETVQIEVVIHPGEDHTFTITSGERGGAMVPSKEIDSMEKKAKESQSFRANFSLRKLAPRFTKELLGKEMVDGREAYVVAFHPKDNQPVQERVEKILNALDGKIWISTTDYCILKTDAKLAHTVSLAWFFATMESMNFYYESQALPDGNGPAKFNVSYEVGVMLTTIRERNQITMHDFKNMSQPGASAPVSSAGRVGPAGP